LQIDRVPSRDPGWIIVGQPDLAVAVFPNERLQRKVNAGVLARLHERRAPARVAENDQCGRTQCRAGLGGSGRVIDLGEEGRTFCFNGRFDTFYCVLHRTRAEDGD
jgi:hypothetical protein